MNENQLSAALEHERNLLAQERNLFSQERTRLASERTFLAWIRTGLTGIGIGIAIARLVIFQSSSHQLVAHFVGQALILWGIGIFIIALFSYRRSVRKIAATTVPARGLFFSLAVVTLVLVVLALIVLWIVVE